MIFVSSIRMKQFLAGIILFYSFSANAQTVSGYWYGNANVKTSSSANNYLVELVLNQNKSQVKGVLNYYFKNTFRSIAVNGNYNAASRRLTLFDVPVTYHGSLANMEVDCIMNLIATLRVSKADSKLIGIFAGQEAYKNTCADISFTLNKDGGVVNQDSVLNALRLYKETYQVWKPSATDTLVAANIIQRKVINYVIEKQYKERENVVADEITVHSDSIKVDFYDNGEVDGDSISVFFNNQLLAFNRMISTKAVHFNLVLDSSKEVNELTMFADNLGAIPPNTALMVIYDGDKRYEIRLSSSLDKNATVRFRRSGK
ncbi:MAG TPA: hypothetical protein VFS36_00665 [Chitinophagaceae bacterium]|jgi:hypothetical protein|nr:hypothetical protein [Chitinophagaceae bacterium]